MNSQECQRNAKTAMWRRSILYLRSIGLFNRLDIHYSKCVAAYILSIHEYLPVKTIIVGERPYSTKIHPVVSSAMSYDRSKSPPTPSTIGVARDLCGATKIPFKQTEEWVRDGWMYLNSGTVLVNCMTFIPFSSSESLIEIISFQKWLRCLLDCSVSYGKGNVDIICMGIPATNVVDAVMRSMGSNKAYVSKKSYPNPAIVSKTRAGDMASQDCTFGKPGTSRSISSAIERSHHYVPLSIDDYIKTVKSTMSSQENQINALMSTSERFVDALDNAYKDLGVDDKMPGLKECHQEFSKALVAYRDTVLRDIIAHSMESANAGNSSKMGKPAEWGSKKKWEKPPASVGTSSRMSTVSEDVVGIEQKFADADNDNGNSTPKFEENPVSTTTPESKPAPKKKKIVVRKRRVASTAVPENPPEDASSQPDPPSTRPVGSTISESEVSTLRSILYYVTDTYGESEGDITSKVNATMANSTITDDNVSLMLGSAARDFQNDGITASKSLGLDDGEMSTSALLPQVIAKLVENSKTG